MEQKDFIRTVFNEYIKKKVKKMNDAKTNEIKIFYYGQITGIIELLPSICVRKYKEIDTSFIGEVLGKIDKFVNYSFSSKGLDKPEYYDFIMELLDEESKS